MEQPDFVHLHAVIESRYAAEIAAAKRKRHERLNALATVWDVRSAARVVGCTAESGIETADQEWPDEFLQRAGRSPVGVAPEMRAVPITRMPANAVPLLTPAERPAARATVAEMPRIAPAPHVPAPRRSRRSLRFSKRRIVSVASALVVIVGLYGVVVLQNARHGTAAARADSEYRTIAATPITPTARPVQVITPSRPAPDNINSILSDVDNATSMLQNSGR